MATNEAITARREIAELLRLAGEQIATIKNLQSL
jgi:hypothetical protein